MKQNRRTFIAGSTAIVIGSAAAGCLDETETTVSVLAESVGGHGHDHSLSGEFLDDDHDEDHDYHHDGLTHDEIDHACGHKDFDEFEPMEGATSPDDAPHFSETHTPYDVTFSGDTGYVVFEADDDHDHDHSLSGEFLDDDGDHDHDHNGDMFAFFSEAGEISVHEGHSVYEEHGVDDCGAIGMYVIAEPDHGEVVLELTE